MKIKEVIPILELALGELRAIPEDIDIIGIETTLRISDQYITVHVSEADDIRRLASIYGCGVHREVEAAPDKEGNVWTWRRFSSPDKFLRFVQCEYEKVGPGVTSTEADEAEQDSAKDTMPS